MKKIVIGILFACAASRVAVNGQMKNTAIPRAADGHPDLTGIYDLATMTPLERPANTPAVMSDEEAAKREAQEAARNAALDKAVDANRPAPPKGGDGSVGAAGNVGGYNNFWLDRGNAYSIVDGQRRTSILIDPPEGRVPPLTPEARQRQMQRAAQFRPTSDQSENAGDPG